MKSGKIVNGGMAEWLKAAVLKTVDGETRPGVRIPLPPPNSIGCSRFETNIPAWKFEVANILQTGPRPTATLAVSAAPGELPL